MTPLIYSGDTKYETGFRDGVLSVCDILLRAAIRIEVDKRAPITHKESGKAYQAIVKSGDRVFAQRLRDLATELLHLEPTS